MKLDTDNAGNVVISADGRDSPVVDGIPQGIILILRNGVVITVWEKNGRIQKDPTYSTPDEISSSPEERTKKTAAAPESRGQMRDRK